MRKPTSPHNQGVQQGSKAREVRVTKARVWKTHPSPARQCRNLQAERGRRAENKPYSLGTLHRHLHSPMKHPPPEPGGGHGRDGKPVWTVGSTSLPDIPSPKTCSTWGEAQASGADQDPVGMGENDQQGEATVPNTLKRWYLGFTALQPVVKQDVVGTEDVSGKGVFPDRGVWGLVQVGQILQSALAEVLQSYHEGGC